MESNKLMKIFKKKEKKGIESLVFFVVILIVTVIAINLIIKDDKKEEELNTSKNKKLASSSETTQNELGLQLEEILKQIQGISDVKVFVNYSSNEQNDEEDLFSTKQTNSKIEGAIVTAKGTKNANVKTTIIQAVEAVTGLATHKIQVFEMN